MNEKIIFLILVLMVLSSCQYLARPTERPIAVDYRKGISGLSIEFLKNMPPNEFYEGQDFKIGLKIKNEGGYDIGVGEISIAGLNEKYNVLEKKREKLKALKGKSIVAPAGDFYIEEFPGENIKIPEGAKEYKAKFFVLAEYGYKTVANLDVCINPYLYELRYEEGICKVKDSVSLSGQGAPVVVSKVEEIISIEEEMAKVEFKIQVENKGGGKVVGPIRVEEVKLAAGRLQCKQREVKLTEKKKEAVIVCSGLERKRGAYTTTLSIGFSYTYQIEKEGEFTIKRLY